MVKWSHGVDGAGPTRLASSRGERDSRACRGGHPGGVGRAGRLGRGLGAVSTRAPWPGVAGPVLSAACPWRLWAPRRLRRDQGLRLRAGANGMGRTHFKL